MKIKNKYTNQGSREASRKSRIFLISLEYVCIYLCMYLFIYLCHTSGPKENRYRPENWHINSQWPYLKTVIFFFEKITMKAACPRKTAMSRRFSAYILDCLVFSIFYQNVFCYQVVSYFFLFFVRSLDQTKNVRDLKSGWHWYTLI